MELPQKLKVHALQKRKVEFSLVFLVFLIGFLFYLWVFFRHELITMVDGPYYLIQVKSVLTMGGLVYGDPPLTFYLFSFFSILFRDIMLGVKVGVSFFCALSTVPAFFLMKRVGKGVLAGFVAMLLVVFSAPYIRMMADFMKNAVGVCWLFAFIYYLHDLAFSGFKKGSLVLAAFFLVLTGLTHILDFSVALLFLALYTVLVLIFNVNRRSFLKVVIIMALVICAFVLVASTFFGYLFTDFNKILSFLRDLTALQVSHAQTPIPPTPRPFPRPRPFGPPIPFSLSIIGGWGIILLILSSGAILSIYVWKKREKEALLLLTATTIIGSMICFPLIPNEWLSRFMLMIVVPTAIILSYGLSKMWSLASGSLKSVFSLVFVAVCLAFFVVQSVNLAVSTHPTISVDGYLDLVDMKDRIPHDSIIVVSGHGFGYWVQYVTEVDVGHLSPDLWQSYSHVLGLFFKHEIPPILFKTIFVGNVFILVELQQK